MAACPLGGSAAQDRRPGAGTAAAGRPRTPQTEPLAALPGPQRRAAVAALARGLRPGPRGRPPDDQHAALRRADARRHRHVPPLDRRDADRRGQDADGHAADVPARPGGQGLPPGHGQRLPGPPRRRLDGADLQGPGADRGRGRDRRCRSRSAARPTPATSPTARPRSSASTSSATGCCCAGSARGRPTCWAACSASGRRGRREARPGRALLRPGRRGRQHPHRRGPHAADHQRPAHRGAAAGGGVLQVERLGRRRSSSRTTTTSTTTRRRPSS